MVGRRRFRTTPLHAPQVEGGSSGAVTGGRVSQAGRRAAGRRPPCVTHNSDRRTTPRHRQTQLPLFAREAVRNFRDVGAVAPSGHSLSRAMTDAVARTHTPARVLEVGAGTGTITAALLDRLNPADTLDIVEVNPAFARRLRLLARRRGPGPAATVHQTRLESFDTEHRYDAIISGLPFANLDVGQVAAITDRYRDLLTPGGVITYFAYRGTSRLRALSMNKFSIDRHSRVEHELAVFRRGYQTRQRTVWANVPPARVWELTLPAGGDAVR